jgi:hypothetical protein
MNKAGKYVSNLSGEYEYKSFLPAPLPPVIETDGKMTALLVEANKQIYALESITSHIPSIKLFTSMYVRKEALMSSQIEGTQATLEDVLDPTLEQNSNRDLSEVVVAVCAERADAIGAECDAFGITVVYGLKFCDAFHGCCYPPDFIS